MNTDHNLEHVLTSARELLANARYCACLSGAGLSAESGIATFRDADSDGLWDNFNPMELASVEGFTRNPERVMKWYNARRTKLSEVQPNPGHLALAEQKNLLHITQNVDNLCARAGTDPEQLVQLHGTITEDHCLECGAREAIDTDKPKPLRICSQCNSGYMRPSVVWFGEMLPDAAWHRAEATCLALDVLLVVGTSASVYPAAGLIDVARNHGARVIHINPDGEDIPHEDMWLQGKSGDLLPKLLQGLTLSSPEVV